MRRTLRNRAAFAEQTLWSGHGDGIWSCRRTERAGPVDFEAVDFPYSESGRLQAASAILGRMVRRDSQAVAPGRARARRADRCCCRRRLHTRPAGGSENMQAAPF